MNTCPGCDGSGCGPCANCGDGYAECSCDEPDHDECDQCDGTGEFDGSDEDRHDFDDEGD